MVTVTRGKFHSATSALHFAYDRIIRIYPLYWLYGTIFFVIHMLKSNSVDLPQVNWNNILASYLLLPNNSPPLLLVAWTLVHTMFFYGMFTLFLLFLSEDKLFIALAGWAILTGIGQIYCTFSQNCGPILNLVTHPHTYEFIAGCLVGKIYYRGIRRFGWIILLLGVILLIGAIAWLGSLPTGLIVTGWDRVILFGIPAVLIVYSVIALESNGTLVIPGKFQSIGDTSYSIYLSHLHLIAFLGLVWSSFSTPDPINHLVALLGMMIVAILFGLLSYHFIEKPFLQKLRAWGDFHLPKIDSSIA